MNRKSNFRFFWFLFFELRLIDYIYNLLWHIRSATDQKKKVVQKLVHEFFFVRELVFEIWSILYMADFVHGWFCMHAEWVCHTAPRENWCNQPYTKSTISQKLKLAQVMNKKIIFRAFRIFHKNLATFKQKKNCFKKKSLE